MVDAANIKSLRMIDEYKKRFPTSEVLFKKAKKCLPAGVSSTARTTFSGWEPYPLFVDHGEGSHVVDVDGNEFIDYLIGLGPMMLGHRPKEITDAVVNHISNVGTVFALASELDGIVAEKVCDAVPGMEKVRFVNSGTEAVIYALRLARIYTGRNKIVRFEGMYHGFSDTIYWNKHPSQSAWGEDGYGIPEAQGAGVPEGYGNELLIAQWNDLDSLTKLVEAHHNEIAAIITEPVMCNTGCILPEPGYLEGMRALTEKYGIVLIFDEVITGFRISRGGAQAHYGIVPDLSTFAKGIGGGFPVAALGGKAEIMNLIDQGKASVAGTYSGNGIALAATNATMDYLKQPGVFEACNAKAARLREGLNDMWKASPIPAYVVGVGPTFQVWFAEHPIKNYRDAIRYANSDLFSLWWEEMLLRGVLFHPHYFENIFVSMAHTDKDIDETLTKAQEAIHSMEERLGYR